MQTTLQKDLIDLLNADYIPFRELKNKTFLITGSTGMLGYNIINSLVFLSEKLDLNITIHAIARNPDKVRTLFSKLLQNEKIFFYYDDIFSFKNNSVNYDYILHTASPTSSRYFIEHPVEIIDFAYKTTKHLLELARHKKSTFIYFSSMEIYGTPTTDKEITEDFISSCPQTMNSRSSYSEGKRLCETLVKSYNEEYDVNCNVLRLTQTFGPGVMEDDNRVFAQFARAARKGDNIILLSKGNTKRSYLYTMDLVSGLFTILLKGKPGEAYNIANEETYCSIREMAELALSLSEKKCRLEFKIENTKSNMYLPPTKFNLNCNKIKSLGWYPRKDLKNMFLSLISFWKECDKNM